MSLPLVIIGAGVVFLLAALRVLIRQRRTIETVPCSNTSIEVPKRWDDGEIARLLQRHHDQPAVLAHTVSSIKSRMVLNQDVKVATQRLKVMASVIEVFKLNKELQGVLDDLRLAGSEFEIRQVETDIRLDDAQSRQKSDGRLRQLRAHRDELQLEQEIATLGEQIEKTKAPAKAEPKLTPEEQRAKDKNACETRIANLRQEKQSALKLPDEVDRVMRVNAVDDALQREMERWAKLL